MLNIRPARLLVLLVVPAIVGRGAFPQPASAAARERISFDQVTLRGEYGARFQAAAANLLTRQDRYSIASYVSNASAVPGAALWPDWPGDQFGRMFSVWHVAEGFGWTPARTLRRAVADAVFPFQTKAGHFGTENPLDRKDARIVSGNAFALRGLLDAYRDTGDTRFLDSARRLGRYDEAIFESWKDNGQGMVHEYYGHCLDGLVALYEIGGDRWALDLARRIAVRVGRTPHTHHSLSMIRGVIDLYRTTGEKTFLERAEDYLGYCRESRIVSGGLPEEMPRSEQDEGCALADYVVVNLMMFEATGRPAYLEDAERTLVNHFFMNQFHTGGFGHRQFAPDVIGGKKWQGWEGRFGSENPGCCSLWGCWALGQAASFIVTRAGGAVDVNLYPSASILLPDLSARLDMESDFPRMSKVALTVHGDKAAKYAIRLRLPAWAHGSAAKLNGKDAGAAAADGRIVLAREWRSGDRLDIAFGGGLRLVSWPDEKAATAAVFDGPLCLSLSGAAADVDRFQRLLITPQGTLLLSADGKPQAADEKGGTVSLFKPIAEDWLSPDVKNPNRLRILFTKETRIEGGNGTVGIAPALPAAR